MVAPHEPNECRPIYYVHVATMHVEAPPNILFSLEATLFMAAFSVAFLCACVCVRAHMCMHACMCTFYVNELLAALCNDTSGHVLAFQDISGSDTKLCIQIQYGPTLPKKPYLASSHSQKCIILLKTFLSSLTSLGLFWCMPTAPACHVQLISIVFACITKQGFPLGEFRVYLI